MNNICKRRAVIKALATLPLLPWAAGGHAARSGNTGLNILFIICDDLNASHGAATPNLNRLRSSSVWFSNAHCNASICGPSRASFLTGIYPSTSGYYGYKQQANRWRRFPVLQDAVTIMEHFKAGGYQVGATGKIFHNGHEDKSVWSTRGSVRGSGHRPSFGPWPWDGKTRDAQYVRNIKAVRHPSVPGNPNARWGGFGPLSDVPTVAGNTGWFNDDGSVFHYVSEDDRDPMPDEMNAEWARHRLMAKHADPFLMMVGFNRPHAPMYAPERYFRQFPLDAIVLPPYLENDLEDVPAVLWKTANGKRSYPASALTRLFNAGGVELWKRWLQAYLASVSFVDEQLGIVLDALAQGPNADNTVVVFASDHGFHMGEKDHLSKTTTWDEVTRVPLAIRAPGLSRNGLTCSRPVTLIDLYPTLIDVCGVNPNPNAGGNGVPLDGHSLKPLLRDPENGGWEGPDVAFTALHGNVALANNQPGLKADQHFSVRSGRFRYTLCNNAEEELYDHSVDPHEWTNLAGDKQYAGEKSNLKQQLLALRGQGPRPGSGIDAMTTRTSKPEHQPERTQDMESANGGRRT